MRKVHPPKLRDFFKINKDWASLHTFYYYHNNFFNPFVLFTFFIFLSLIFGISYKILLNISISVTVFIAYLYYRTKNLAYSLSIKREAPNKGREKDEVIVLYTLINRSGFNIDNLYFSDNFTGAAKQLYLQKIPPIINGTKKIIKVSYMLDGGMGNHQWEKLSLYLTDHLGIFQFEIIEDKINKIKVFPLIEKIRDFPICGELDSVQFGLYDMLARGYSSSFIGIKEYQTGDPVNRINWKLSQKSNKIIVNEFEKNTNSTITIIINTNTNLHMGLGTTSTLEYCKDAALAIASSQIIKGNKVQIITSNSILPVGMGQTHINFLELAVCNLSLCNDLDPSTLVRRNLKNIIVDSTIFYITPCLIHISFSKNLLDLKMCTIDHPFVHAILIDGFKETRKQINITNRLEIETFYQQTKKTISEIKETLTAAGISTYHVEVDSGKARPFDFYKTNSRRIEQ